MYIRKNEQNIVEDAYCLDGLVLLFTSLKNINTGIKKDCLLKTAFTSPE